MKQTDIIKELGTVPNSYPDIEVTYRVEFLANYLLRSGLKGFVLGISGGQDSLLAGILAQRAVDQLRAEGHDVAFHAMLLPYGQQADREDALRAIKIINPDRVHDIDISLGVDALVQTFNDAGQHVSDYDKGNIKARMRMISQYAIAGKYGLLVIGTDHAAEAVTGFFTKYGDGGADILPLSGLTKRQGRAILEYLGVPEIFTAKAPTADLLDAHPGQADEAELGITYDEIDDYLEGKAIPEPAHTIIELRYDITAHKRALPVSFI